MPDVEEQGAAGERGLVPRAVGLFGAIALAFAAAYLGSAAWFADLGVFAPGDPRSGGGALPRFNAALALVGAYLCAAVWLGQRWAASDFEALRGVAEASGADWPQWVARARRPGARPLALAVLAGFAFGVLVDVIGRQTSETSATVWPGHVLWVHVLNPLLFAVMGVLVLLSSARARVYRELGCAVHVQPGDLATLAPFARAGLRVALLWFVGTSLASVLLVDTDSPELVLAILAGTAAIGAASVLAPSRGVHQKLREVKQQELAWLRERIAQASGALRRGDDHAAAPLPALLAWEERVRDAPEWPFDTSAWLRFALLLLVPLVSWLGGALVEYGVERWLGG